MLEVARLDRNQVTTLLLDVAKLRIDVFRDWPYLYDGDLEYEKRYLKPYEDSATAIVVGAFDGARLVGASTGTPMTDHASEFGEAFANTGLDLEDVFYCAESVLLPAYRGHGIGHRFFDLREAHARALGKTFSAFCSVVRPLDHPLRPNEARSLEPFWRARGYEPLDGVLAGFSWKDLNESDETLKSLAFWLKRL